VLKVVAGLFSLDRGKPGRAMPDRETTRAHEAIGVPEMIRGGETQLHLQRPSPRRPSHARHKGPAIPNHGPHNRVAIPIQTTGKRCPEPAECRRPTIVANAEARSPVAIAAV